MGLDFAADGNLRELSGEEAWETIENFVQGQKEWENPQNIIFKQKIENLKVHAKRLFGNENVWVEMHRNIAWDKVKNPNPQSTPQVPSSFEETTPHVTHPEEVDKTIGIPTDVEPLDYMKLKDIGLNTCSRDLFFSSREVPSFDEPDLQPQPFPRFSSLNIDLGEERDPEPTIKPYSSDSFRMKEMFDDGWGLESKEVSPLGEELSLFDRENEVERGKILEARHLELILQQQISQRMAPSHHD
ncbi:hypothetical protein Tco_0090739, partial [Tanacetum coccineum]